MNKKNFLLTIAATALMSSTAVASTSLLSNRGMTASVNSVKSSVYPTSDSEYASTIGKVLVSWRMMPEDDFETAFDVYRQQVGGNRIKISGDGVIASTCLQDSYTDFSKDIVYELCYKGSTEVIASCTITSEQLQKGHPYKSVPLQKWEGTPEGFIYKVNDCSYGDLDGDGEMEIVVKRGARVDSLLMVNGGLADDERPEIRHTAIWEAYKMDGTMLWRVCSGPNIPTGNSTSFAIYDFDGDGKCEVATRLSEGAVFGDGMEIGDTNGDGKTDYRTFGNIHINGHPEWLCVIDGQTGKELARTDFIPTGNDSEAWGDDYWKRAASIRIGVIKCDQDTTSILIARGVYARSVVETWDYANGKLKQRWRFDSNNINCRHYAGQGYHSLSVGDVDGDGLDEMCYGSMTLDHDGSPMYVSGSKNGKEYVVTGARLESGFTGYGHGDALRLGDFLPYRDGLEIWACFETGDYGAALRAAQTGETIWCHKESGDVGRCCVADLFPEYPGCEMWWYGGKIMTADGEQITTNGGESLSPPANNVAVWFTGSLNRQLLDGNKVCTRNITDGKERRALRANFFDAKAINGTKDNPCLYADLLGDWREEIIYVDSAETQLKIFSTWYPTEYRFHPLLKDHLYEMSALNQNIGYNQSTEMGNYLGSDLLTTVEFKEANGLTPTIKIYRDSLHLSQINNGQLIKGRKYYFYAVSFKGGVKKMNGEFYMPYDTNVVEYDIVNGTMTGIKDNYEFGIMNSDSAIYDLMGRRMVPHQLINSKTHQLKKGIYIINGKKVFLLD